MVKHVKLKIFGRVQGVLFRASAKREAEKLGVAGFIRNESDGSIYIEAEGHESNLNKFLKWCGYGPIMAKVVRVETEEGPVKHFTDFKVL